MLLGNILTTTLDFNMGGGEDMKLKDKWFNNN